MGIFRFHCDFDSSKHVKIILEKQSFKVLSDAPFDAIKIYTVLVNDIRKNNVILITYLGKKQQHILYWINIL